MKIWILGGKGMLANVCAKMCIQRNLQFIADDRALADITDYDQLLQRARLVQPTHIINCAAYTNVDQAEKNPEIAFLVNATGASFVAKVAKLMDAHFIHISTDYVFSGDQQIPYCEEDVPCPLNVYGTSKLEGENLVLDIHPNTCVLRTSWVFGAGGKNFISSLLSLLQNQEEVHVIQDQWGCLTYCYDLASVILDLIQERGIYHFVNQGICSRFDIAKELFEKLQDRVFCKRVIPTSAANYVNMAKRPRFNVLGTQKISKKLNNSPRHWKEALGEFFIDAITV
ncbi:MAG: dTDP-4-dehydrorhamnose reductase [Candidatus Rhabdochlamydia sp.]